MQQYLAEHGRRPSVDIQLAGLASISIGIVLRLDYMESRPVKAICCWKLKGIALRLEPRENALLEVLRHLSALPLR